MRGWGVQVEQVLCLGQGSLQSEVPCIVGNGLPVNRQTDRHTRLKTIPHRNFVGAGR